jgi:hypothetical protein
LFNELSRASSGIFYTHHPYPCLSFEFDRTSAPCTAEAMNPVGVTSEEFCEFYPLLYHMAWAGSWPTIEMFGLLSTSALLDVYEVAGDKRARIESMHRSSPVTIRHPSYPPVTVRDQHPMSDSALRRSLQGGMTPADWHRTLNSRVFFWLTEDRLNRMLSSPPYAKLPHLILVLRTSAVVKQNWDRVWLAPMNSGCTVPFAHPRGPDTFSRPADYPWQERKNRGPDRVVEFTVEGGVRNVSSFLLRSEDRVPPESQSELLLL